MKAIEGARTESTDAQPDRAAHADDSGNAVTFKTGGTVPPVQQGFRDAGPSASDRAFGGTESQAPEVMAARELLARVDPADHERLMMVIRRILDGARQADGSTAHALLDLVRPYQTTFPQIGDAIAQTERASAHRPQAIESGPAGAVDFDWTTLLVHGKGATGAPAKISDDERAKLKTIAAGRPALLDAQLARLGSRLDDKQWKPYAGNHGWGYEGNKDAATVTHQSDRILELAVQELFAGKSVEAYVNSVVTYDGTLSVGSGWANGNAAEYLHRWLATDPAARAALLEAGFAVTADQQFVAIDNEGNLAVGGAAMAFLRKHENGKILDYLSGLMEQKGSAQKAMDAQISLVKSTIVDKLKANGVAKAMEGWSDGAVQAAIHLGNWDLAGGPVVNPNDFKATGGDPLKIVHAFAKNMSAYIKKPNGALILGGSMNTSLPLHGHMERWGGGCLSTAIAGTTRRHLTFADAASDPSLAGHVLVVASPVAPSAPGNVDFYDTGTL